MYQHTYDIDKNIDVTLYDIVWGIHPDIGPDDGYLEKAKQTAKIAEVGDSFVVPGAHTIDIRAAIDRRTGKIFTCRQREFGVRVWRHA